MKRTLFVASFLAMGITAFAQSDDPIVMTVGGQPVPRSEFEYSYNKNNTESVIDKKTVEEYVELFANYKRKVLAALENKMDTIASYKKEYTNYRDMQVRPTLINEADVEAEAQKIYAKSKENAGPDGLVATAHILLRLPQKAGNDVQQKVKNRADSIYNAIMAGADFAQMAAKFSEDPGSKTHNGEIGPVGRNQVFKEYEDVAFALKDGEISKPVLSPVGYHIIKMIAHQQYPSYDSLRTDIHRFIEARGIREAIINNKVDQMVKLTGKSAEQVMDMRADSLAALDPDMKYLFKEYHDGILSYDIANREVWEKARQDEDGLKAFYKKNKKKYTWDAPRFKGIAYHTRDLADVEAVKKALKGKPFSEWEKILRTTFNSDSVLRIRVVKGYFVKGKNALVDRDIFKTDTVPTPNKKYPYEATYGTLLNAPKEMEDVREQVVADYSDALEQGWVAVLREKYPLVVNKDVLATVNKH